MKGVTLPRAVTSLLATASSFYVSNESTILSGGSILASGGAIVISIRNSKDILETIAEGKEILAKNSDPDLRKRIYLDILKELTPKVAPIVILYGTSIFFTILNKKHSDKKIADLTASANLAQNAILQYQLWKREAEKELGQEKVDAVNNNVVENVVRHNPPTEKNTEGPKGPMVSSMFCWYDGNTPNRYLWSFKSPNDVRKWEITMNGELNSLQCDGNEIGINDFYSFLSEGLDTNYTIYSYDRDERLKWKLTAEDVHHYSDVVSIDISTTEGPDGRPINAFHCNFYPF